MTFGVIGGIAGFLAVALGAFGAHGLQGHLSPAQLETFETAVRYQMYHALALLLVAVQLGRGSVQGGALAGWGFTIGIVLFSGSLYLMLATGQRWLGAVTPVGGVAFLVGWAALTWSLIQTRGG